MLRFTAAAIFTAIMSAGNLLAVELHLTERIGLTRYDEPVTFGVPLSRGYASDVGELALLSSGRPLQAEIRAVNTWPDGSIRWVHVDCQTSMPAGSSLKAQLVKAQAARVESKIDVMDNGKTLTVRNGVIEATVRKSRFNLIDRLKLSGGNAIVETHEMGLRAWIDGTEYSAANDNATALTVESRGPMRLVLRAEGCLADAGGNKLFNYICRLYFYNGSPVIRVANTFEYREENIEKAVKLQELSIELPLAMGGEQVFSFAGPRGDISGSLTADQSASLKIPSSTEYAFNGAAKTGGTGNPKREKSARLGAVSVSGDLGSVAAAMRDCWRLHPTALEIFDGGRRLSIGLVRPETGRDVVIHPGIARTHYIRMAFGAQTDADTLLASVLACNQPLLAVAAPEWYCTETAALGKIPPRGQVNYQEPYRELTKRLEKELDKGLATMWRMVDGREKNGVTVEGYGLLGWGDGMHHIWKPGLQTLENISWNGHYYDLPHMSFLEFIRSGNYSWLDFSLSRAWHLMDVQVTHFEPGNRFNGSNRYCPPRMHVAMDDGKIYVSNTCNHHKTQGIFDRWYLTGDERALEVALKALNYANSFGEYGNFNQPRGAGFQVLTLVEGFEHTGNPEYLRTARSTFDNWWKHFQNNDQKFTQGLFMVGFLLEAFIDLYEIDPDPRIVDFVGQAVDWMRTNRPDYYPSNLALAVGFLSEQRGDPGLKHLQTRFLEGWNGTPGNQFKDFANSGRSLARAIYYLSERKPGMK